MGLDCEITIPGDGIGRYGRLKHSKTGPVSIFILFNEYVFKHVFKHVKSCDKCGAYEVLKAFHKRSYEWSGGVVSKGLLNCVKKLELLLINSYSEYDIRIVNSFYARSCDVRDFIARLPKMSIREIYDGVGFYLKSFEDGKQTSGHWSVSWLNNAMGSELMSAMFHLCQLTKGTEISDEELQDLLTIHEVMFP